MITQVRHPFAVWYRQRLVHLTDPQRRVYWGVPFSSESVWSSWHRLYGLPTKEEAESSAASWRAINPKGYEYEVRQECEPAVLRPHEPSLVP